MKKVEEMNDPEFQARFNDALGRSSSEALELFHGLARQCSLYTDSFETTKSKFFATMGAREGNSKEELEKICVAMPNYSAEDVIEILPLEKRHEFGT
jgi:hypothetical protein